MELLVEKIRLMLGIPDDLRPEPIETLQRAKLAGILNSFRSVPDEELPNDQARWEQADRAIVMREHTYSAALAGDEEAAFTVFHELGHAVMNHPSRNRKPDGRTQFGRQVEQDEIDADWFARTLMVPAAIATRHDVSSAQSLRSLFGMPAAQAVTRSQELARLKRLRTGTPRLLPSFDGLTSTGDVEVEEEYDRYINAWAHASND